MGIPIVAVPKTIDNDLAATDFIVATAQAWNVWHKKNIIERRVGR